MSSRRQKGETPAIAIHTDPDAELQLAIKRNGDLVIMKFADGTHVRWVIDMSALVQAGLASRTAFPSKRAMRNAHRDEE
jgi:hypothetical protein